MKIAYRQIREYTVTGLDYSVFEDGNRIAIIRSAVIEHIAGSDEEEGAYRDVTVSFRGCPCKKDGSPDKRSDNHSRILTGSFVNELQILNDICASLPDREMREFVSKRYVEAIKKEKERTQKMLERLS